ncbi:MAG: NUDIX hydrolase [Casimicrobium sp.]
MDRRQCDVLLADLSLYAKSANDSQRNQANRIATFVRLSAAPWRRSTLEGHLTASAWIVDETFEHALLVHHKKLSRWLQPGGHIDDTDATVFDAALREASEETGLINLNVVPLNRGTSLFDIDVHAISARHDEPAHFHYDVRYLFSAARTARTTIDAGESNELAWIALAEVADDHMFDASVARMAALTLSRG